MSKFVGVFRELASFNELLHTQVELILVERLHRNWLKVTHGISLHACRARMLAQEVISAHLLILLSAAALPIAAVLVPQSKAANCLTSHPVSRGPSACM